MRPRGCGCTRSDTSRDIGFVSYHLPLVLILIPTAIGRGGIGLIGIIGGLYEIDGCLLYLLNLLQRVSIQFVFHWWRDKGGASAPPDE